MRLKKNQLKLYTFLTEKEQFQENLLVKPLTHDQLNSLYGRFVSSTAFTNKLNENMRKSFSFQFAYIFFWFEEKKTTTKSCYK